MECDGCKVRGNLQSSYVHSASSVTSQGNTFISELGQLSDGLNNTSTIGCLFFLSLSPSLRVLSAPCSRNPCGCDRGSSVRSFLFWNLILILRGLRTVRKAGSFWGAGACRVASGNGFCGEPVAGVLLAPMGFHRCAHPAFGSTVSRSMGTGGTIPAFPAPQQPMFTLNSSISACFPEGLTRARGGNPEIRKRGGSGGLVCQ
jgi:hypothetical protein